MSLIETLKKWNRTREKTNAEVVIGKKAIVTTEINNLKATGTVSLQGMDWTARTKDDSVVAIDSVVKVVAIEGVKVIVEKCTSEEE